MEEPLSFSASLFEPGTRPHRKDGGSSFRSLIINSFAIDEDHPTRETEIREIHPDGSRSTLLKRRRVDKPENANNQNEILRLKPTGQGVSLAARLHWPVLDCVLQPEDILVGQPLHLFHLNMVIDGAADEKTRAWLQEKSLPGADKVVKPAPPPKVLSTLQAEEAAKSGRDAAAAASSSEPLAFFLGGPRPQRAARHELGEEDEGASLKLMRDRASAWPALRGEKAVYGSGRMPPLPSELAKQAKALTYGRDTRLVFFARVVGESGAAAEASAALGGRRLVLSYYICDDTMSLVEIHEGNSGSQFGHARGNSSVSGEKTTLLKRCRAPLQAGPGGLMGDLTVNDACVELTDIYCGMSMRVAGTAIQITSCEPSTRKRLVEGGLAAELGLPRSAKDGEAWPGKDEEPWPL